MLNKLRDMKRRLEQEARQAPSREVRPEQWTQVGQVGGCGWESMAVQKLPRKCAGVYALVAHVLVC